jgi:methionyl-tRNA formyltransferase
MITLFLLGEKGLSALNSLVVNKYNINFVIIGKDNNIKNDFSFEIENFCIKNNINYCFRLNYIYHEWKYAFAIGWKWLIPEIKNLIIFHDSILPKYRGFNPLVTALINGDSKIGVTALFESESVDEGDIIDTSVIEIQYPIKIKDAIEKIMICYNQLVLSIANKIVNNIAIIAYKQNSSAATYSLWRDNDDYTINWNQSSDIISRHIDASGYPYLGAKTLLDGINITILSSEIISDIYIENRSPGKILRLDNGIPIVVCGSGLLRLKDIQCNEESIFPIKKLRSRFHD